MYSLQQRLEQLAGRADPKYSSGASRATPPPPAARAAPPPPRIGPATSRFSVSTIASTDAAPQTGASSAFDGIFVNLSEADKEAFFALLDEVRAPPFVPHLSSSS